jgi:hypothetical protein
MLTNRNRSLVQQSENRGQSVRGDFQSCKPDSLI